MTPAQLAAECESAGEEHQAMTDVITFLAFGFILFGVPAILARLFVKWGIY